LVLLLILLGVISWIRLQRRNDASSSSSSSVSSKAPMPQDMLPCAHCGVHVPRHDTITGSRGVYCSAEHRQQHEG
jgi:uncharacterized protein